MNLASHYFTRTFNVPSVCPPNRLNVFHQMSLTKNSFCSYLYKLLHLVMAKPSKTQPPTFKDLSVEGNKHTEQKLYSSDSPEDRTD